MAQMPEREEGVRLTVAQEQGYLRISMVGRYPAEPLDLYTRVTTTMSQSGQKRFLFDVRELTHWPDHQFTHEFITRHYPESPGHRSAILALPQMLGFARFYETMILNRGYDAKLFKDEAEALAWLLS